MLEDVKVGTNDYYQSTRMNVAHVYIEKIKFVLIDR